MPETSNEVKFILGSSSKYRKEILESKGYEFDVMAPDIDEKAIRTPDSYQLSLLIARAKADALLPQISESSLIVTADQVVVCGGLLHQKPKDSQEARLFLKRYSNGAAAETVSALVVVNTHNNKRAEGVDIAKVYFKIMPPLAIEDFIKNGDPYSKAGGFAIQSPILKPYFNKMEGTEDSVMGMPLKLLEKLIKQVS